MSFKKTGISVSPPVILDGAPEAKETPQTPTLGEEQDGKIWDGKKWVSPEEWAKTHSS